MKIIIFGTGSVSEILVNKLISQNPVGGGQIEIIAFVNSNATIQNFHGFKVITPIRILQEKFDYIVVASGYYLQIEKILLEIGIPTEKIVAYIYDNAETYQEINLAISDFLEKRFNRNIMEQILPDDELLPRIYGTTIWKNHAFKDVYKDFVREQIVCLMSQEIKRKSCAGSIAELGVFRGDFTVAINRAFPDKKLYLFDTFCGFNENDLNADSTMDNKNNELMKFKDTSAEFVLSRLGKREKACYIKQGFFPETFDLWDEKFCFISVDLNLKAPVLASLELLYPRISKGGYMMIATYNAPYYEGTKEAVIQYCDSNNINYLPIPDLWGSIVIMR